MSRALPLLLLLSLAACGGGPPGSPRGAGSSQEIKSVLLPCGEKTKVELALTPEEHARGLMNRPELPAGTGMLFVFPSNAERVFWMKNTLVDLDIIFLDGTLSITSVAAGVPRSRPGVPDSEVAIAAGYGAYVLEIASGAAAACGAVPGSRLVFLAE